MLKVIRSIAFNGFFYLWTGLLAVFSLPVILFGSPIAMRRYARFWIRGILGALRLLVGLKHRIHGLENLPDRPVIIACKHQSAWETLFFYTLRLDLAVALKEELTWIPLFGWCLDRAGNIKLDRGGAAKTLRSLVKGGKRAIKNRDCILIFPEGTRKAPGAPPDYKPGVAALYAALDVPCIPVALNSGCFWGRRKMIKEPGTIDIEFLPPIPPGLKRGEFMNALETSIETATHRLVEKAETAD